LGSSIKRNVREFIVVDGMANNAVFQVNPIPNQYGVYLDLVYCNFSEMVGVAERLPQINFVGQA
jgi:hypothetical protein